VLEGIGTMAAGAPHMVCTGARTTGAALGWAASTVPEAGTPTPLPLPEPTAPFCTPFPRVRATSRWVRSWEFLGPWRWVGDGSVVQGARPAAGRGLG
jgi:hypothetical protein